jgi:hypothetical protein
MHPESLMMLIERPLSPSELQEAQDLLARLEGSAELVFVPTRNREPVQIETEEGEIYEGREHFIFVRQLIHDEWQWIFVNVAMIDCRAVEEPDEE